jgi:hypothetical protein
VGRPAAACRRLGATLAKLGVEHAAHDLLDRYKQQAAAALRNAPNGGLKGLLRRLLGKIFYDIETMGCCLDAKPNAPAGETSS